MHTNVLFTLKKKHYRRSKGKTSTPKNVALTNNLIFGQLETDISFKSGTGWPPSFSQGLVISCRRDGQPMARRYRSVVHQSQARISCDWCTRARQLINIQTDEQPLHFPW